MILICPACQTRYQVDATKFPPEGRNVRCARCGEVWHQDAPQDEIPPSAEAAADLAGEPAPEPAPEPESEAAPESENEPAAEAASEPAFEMPPSDPADAPQTATYAEPAAPEAGAQPSRPRSPLPRQLALGTGWVTLAAVVVAVIFVMAAWRQQIVQVWPQSASLYAVFGAKVNPLGLDIVDVKSSQAPQNGQIVLTVSGALTNVSKRELPVPQIRVGLADGDKRELYHWTFAPEVMTLKPGQTTHFVTRLASPPDGARHLEVRFAKAGE
jgi:predicted Zn finger-like uncharacterized protein